MIEIYWLKSPSGKCYVGLATAGAAARWRSHTFDSRRGSRLPLHRAIRKYGPSSFRRVVLERCADRPSAMAAEQAWIVAFGCQLPEGYNATAGGDGTHGLCAEARARIGSAHRGKTVTAEARARMSLAHMGQSRAQSPEHRAMISAALTGRRLSSETKERVRSANVGKKASAETRARMAESQRLAWVRRRAVVGGDGP